MASSEKEWTLYILKLEGEKWYVGVTAHTAESQLTLHKSGGGSEWTKKYKPVALSNKKELGSLTQDEALKIEGKMLRKYMEHYGDGNVRGGELARVKRQEPTKKRSALFIKIGVIVALVLLSLTTSYLLFDKFVIQPSVETVIIQ